MRLFHSVNCGFWTIDFDKLSSNGGIPCCPTCGSPGFETTTEEWDKGLDQMSAKYVDWIDGMQEKCNPKFKEESVKWARIIEER